MNSLAHRRTVMEKTTCNPQRGLAIGLALGIGIGFALDNIVVGIGIGTALGLTVFKGQGNEGAGSCGKETESPPTEDS
jgi:hypothetical protein